MDNRFKNKKGYTLVELVVTIAILAIVAGMGVGIFAMTMNNYSKAASTSSQQDDAVLIENDIVNNARVAKEVYFIPSSDTDSLVDGKAKDAYPRDTFQGIYFANAKGDNTIERFSYYKDPSGSSYLKDDETVYQNVKQITFKLYKRQSAGSTGTDGFIYLEYKIEMNDGYSIDGSVVLNNVKLTGATATKIVAPGTESTDYVLMDASSNTAVVFERDKT